MPPGTRQPRIRPTGDGCWISGRAGPTGSPRASAASSAVTTRAGSTSIPRSASTPAAPASHATAAGSAARPRPPGAGCSSASPPGAGCFSAAAALETGTRAAALGTLTSSSRKTCPSRGPTVARTTPPSRKLS
jgi:hypothetical protein